MSQSRGITHIFHGLASRVVITVLIAHAILIPLLFVGVLYIVTQGYKTQFIDQARSNAYLISILAGKDLRPEALQTLADETLLNDDVVFMDVIDNSNKIVTASTAVNSEFREDFFFGQHGDSTYFVLLPIHSNAGDDNMLRIGFDETPTLEQINLAYWRVFYLAAGYMSFVMFLVFFGARALKMMKKELALQTGALEHQATHDTLSGLPNRVLFNDRLHQAILAARREGTPIALFVMDLDRFKEVNDTLGHQAGDAILCQVATRLQGTIREVDTVARLGGDEFAIVLPIATINDAAMIAKKILDSLREPFRLGDRTLDIGASVGISLFPDHGDDVMSLLRRADVAMYVAKQNGGGFVFYDSSLDQNALDQLNLTTELRQGIEKNEFEIYYQPKVNLSHGKIYGVEALVRWQHPRWGLILPDKFIHITERTGIIHALTLHVLDSATRQCKRWHDEGLRLDIAVNLSPVSLMDSQFAEKVHGILQSTALDPSFLILEITEGALMPDEKQSHETLTRLAALGVGISVDDFGTGHSGLARLKKFPVSELKIDKSFVMDMLTDSDSAAIVRTTIDLAQSLGLKVVAEGVETLQHLDKLRDLGCDLAQGYYISRPVPPSAIRSLCHENRKPTLANIGSTQAASC